MIIRLNNIQKISILQEVLGKEGGLLKCVVYTSHYFLLFSYYSISILKILFFLPSKLLNKPARIRLINMTNLI